VRRLKMAVISTNMASLVAQKNLTRSQDALATSVERLSSGTRINRAKDDAAGLGISEVLKSQVQGVNAAIRNANDAISVVQTTEGALKEVSDMLQRLKELATQGANDALSTDQMNSINDEVTSLVDEIAAVKERTTFNGISLLDTSGDLQFQTGNGTADTTIVSLSAMMMTSLVTTTALTSPTAGSDFNALTASVETDIKAVATARGKLGAVQNRLDHAIGNLEAQSENLQNSRSRIVDTDYAAETAQLTKTQIQQQAATAMLAQANQMPNVVLSLLK